MKRRGRKSKIRSPGTNEMNSKSDENGGVSDSDEGHSVDEPRPKQKKFNAKRISPKKKVQEVQIDEPQYEVEKIMDAKNIRGVLHYLIRWKGYEPESDTWEPESTLNCAELITDFKSKQKKKKKSKLRTSSTGAEESWDDDADFEVDRILEVHFKRDGKREFLVSWKGYPSSQNSWEPEENMDCTDLIQKFMNKVDRAKEVESKELRTHRTHTDRFTLSMRATGRRLSKRNNGQQRIHYYDTE